MKLPRATLASSPRVDGPAGAPEPEIEALLDELVQAALPPGDVLGGERLHGVQAVQAKIVEHIATRLRAAPSPEIGALLDEYAYAVRHAVPLSHGVSMRHEEEAERDARKEVEQAFATLTARAAEAERRAYDSLQRAALRPSGSGDTHPTETNDG